MRLAIEAGAKKLLLWHLNQDRADDQVDEMLELAEEAAGKTRGSVVCEMARTGLQIEI